MKKVTVYIADDNIFVREGVKAHLSDSGRFSISGESGDGETALREILKLKPQVAILDISMPILTGIDVTRELRLHNNEVKIIIMSLFDNRRTVTEAVNSGINGYILKDDALDELFEAIDEVISGRSYFSKALRKYVAYSHS